MFEIIFEILFPLIAFWAGYIYRETLLLKDLIKVSNNINQKINEEVKKSTTSNTTELNIKNIKSLKHEIINSVHYFYLEKDQQFICQGKTLNEAAINYTSVHGPDILGHFKHLEHNKSYCFVNNQCLEFMDE